MDLPPPEIEYEESHISDDDSATIATVVAVSFFVALVAVILRLLHRRIKHQSLQNHDFMAIVALAFIAAFSATIGTGLYIGSGKHIILSSFIMTFEKAWIATQVLFIVALVPLKLSIILFYHQFTTTTFQCRALWFLGIWIVCIGIAGETTTLLDCANAPVVSVGTHCVTYKAAVLSHGSQDVLTYLILLCWPVSFIWGAKVCLTRKLHLLGVFALGACACAASIIRLIYSTNEYLLDRTWSSTAPTIYSILELTLSLTAASLAPLSPLLHYALPSYAEATSPTTGARNRNHSSNSDAEIAIATGGYASPTIMLSPTTTVVDGTFSRVTTVSGEHSTNGKRTRALSSKSLATTPATAPTTPSTPSKWKHLLSRNQAGSGASSPGFTWRCSGRADDLAKWKTLPPPPVPVVPGNVALASGPASPRSGGGEEMEEVKRGFRGEPLFRAVHYS